MNVLFLSIGKIDDLTEKGIYTDLIRKFKNEGHQVYLAHPLERRLNKKTEYIKDQGVEIIKIKIGNITKVNLLEKGISTLLIEVIFLRYIKQYFKNVKFDLIIYSTPPITFERVIRYIKQRDNAKSYLLLKDIFPQNAIDLKMFSKSGVIYKFFRRKEIKLYQQSDYIGCMSEANRNYLLNHNKYLDQTKVEINPNSINPDVSLRINKLEMRKKYGLPFEKTVFVYGGNLGKPQGIDFIIKCLKALENNQEAYFLIVGSGTEYKKIEAFIQENNPRNVKLLNYLPKVDYEQLINSCDVGLVFLDYNFTIPNFPSRILSYMEASMPILTATDPNTDVGKTIQKEGFGYCTLSNNENEFIEKVNLMLDEGLRKEMGVKARKYLLDNYHVDNSYETIMNHFK